MDPFLKTKIGDQRVVLASASPRRHNLLRELGIDFDIRTAEIDEDYPDNLKKEQIPVYLAELKASAFKAENMEQNELLITADTIILLNDSVLTKPVDREDARHILRQISGNKHEVYSSVCLKSRDKLRSFQACTEVFFRELSDAEINYYIDAFQPYDKAGSYGIQEWIGYIGIEKIRGAFYNVMGLPVQKLYEELLKF